MNNLIIWEQGVVRDPWMDYLAKPFRNHISAVPTRSCFLFDLRVMNKAISESGGKAADDTDLGAVSYYYDDVKNNNGKITLPFG